MSKCFVFTIALLTTALSACAESGIEEINPTLTSNVDFEVSNPTSTLDADSKNDIDILQTTKESTRTPTPIPSITLTLQSTVFPTMELPDVELSESGPWLIVSSDSLLYAFNTDGSGKTLLIDKIIQSYSLSPSGSNIAYITDIDSESGTYGLQLRIINISEGQDRLITNLQDPSFVQTEAIDGFDTLFEAMRAITMSWPRWSHNGKYLAFIGQTLGPTADLYVYDLNLDTITQLTDGPSQAYRPSWSPDNSYIFHSGAWSFGTGAGFSDAGSWVVSRDGSEIIETTTGMGSDHLILWQNSDRFLMGTWSQPCGIGFLQSYRITTDETTDIWPYYLGDLAYDSSTGKLIISVPKDFDFCMSEDQPTGLYIIDEFGAEPRLIPDIEVDSVIEDPSLHDTFLLSNSKNTYRLNPDDVIEIVRDAPGDYWDYSKQADLWLWYGSYDDSAGLWIGNYSTEPRQLIDHRIADAIWSPYGNAIFFVSEVDGFLYVARSPEFNPVIIYGGTRFDERSYLYWIEQ